MAMTLGMVASGLSLRKKLRR
jgi:hypothetical protein